MHDVYQFVDKVMFFSKSPAAVIIINVLRSDCTVIIDNIMVQMYILEHFCIGFVFIVVVFCSDKMNWCLKVWFLKYMLTTDRYDG